MDEHMERLRVAVETEGTVWFWGSERKIAPRLLPKVYGAGDCLCAIVLLNTRPNYYVIIGDASWFSRDDDADFFAAFDEEIQNDIDEAFGADSYDEDGNEIEEEDRETGWPIPNWDSGWASDDVPRTPEIKAAWRAFRAARKTSAQETR